jgi:hypothetical protein
MKPTEKRDAKKRTAKSVLRLPDLEVAKSSVLNSLSCPDAQRGYRHLQQREGHWAIVDLSGKGGHVRTVPVPDWVYSRARCVDRSCGTQDGKGIPSCEQRWQGLGRRGDRKACLARR